MEKATIWRYSVALTHLTARQIMLQPKHNGTVSPESLWRMTGGSQIGNCIKSVGTQCHENGRPNLEISDTSVTKNDMGSRKCPFRRACAVEWFGQISRLGSSVASIWYMATDFGRRFVTWEHYTTWAQSRDFRGRKCLFHIICYLWPPGFIRIWLFGFPMSLEKPGKHKSK